MAEGSRVYIKAAVMSEDPVKGKKKGVVRNMVVCRQVFG